MSTYLDQEYPTYEIREKAKREGWEKIAIAKSVREKAFYFVNYIIWSHYWRAREDIESKKKRQTILRKIRGKKYYPYYQLDIDHYTRHWLHANRKSLSEEVLGLISEEWGYEPEENKFLPEGCTQYQF